MHTQNGIMGRYTTVFQLATTIAETFPEMNVKATVPLWSSTRVPKTHTIAQ